MQYARRILLVACLGTLGLLACARGISDPVQANDEQRSAIIDSLFPRAPLTSKKAFDALSRTFPEHIVAADAESSDAEPPHHYSASGPNAPVSSNLVQSSPGGSFWGTYWLSDYTYLRVYGPHWGGAGPKVGYATHMNFDVYSTDKRGKDRDHGGNVKQKANLHVSFVTKSSQRCLYIFDNISGREQFTCTPSGNWRQLRDSAATIVQGFFASVLGIAIAWWLAQAIGVLLAAIMVV